MPHIWHTNPLHSENCRLSAGEPDKHATARSNCEDKFGGFLRANGNVLVYMMVLRLFQKARRKIQ